MQVAARCDNPRGSAERRQTYLVKLPPQASARTTGEPPATPRAIALMQVRSASIGANLSRGKDFALVVVQFKGMFVIQLEARVFWIFLLQEAFPTTRDLDFRSHESNGNASAGVQTIGSPRTLKLVFTTTGQPVRALNSGNQRVIAGV